MRISTPTPNITPLGRWLTSTVLLFLLGVGFAIYFIAQPLHGRFVALNALTYFFFGLAALSLLLIFATAILGLVRYLPDNFKAAPLLPIFIVSFGGFIASATQSKRLYLEDNMQLTFGGDYVGVHGAIAVSLPDQLKHSMAADFRPHHVLLSNQGGSVEAAIAAAEFLKSRGVTTAVVDGDCASSCAYMTLLFPQRLATPNARLGFHDLSSFATGEKKDADQSRAVLTASLVAAGIPAAIVKEFFRTKELRYPRREELLAQKLLTGCWDESLRAEALCASSGEAKASP